MQGLATLAKRTSRGSARALTSVPARTFAGGGKIEKMPEDQNDFDICVVGGYNGTALVKFWQHDGISEKMAMISDESKFMIPEAYYLGSYGVIKALNMESSALRAQVKANSRTDPNTRVTEIKPHDNKIVLDNGREYSYQSLVLAPGFQHSAENIEGLAEHEINGEQGNVFVHSSDTVARLDKNHFHGFHHHHGDLIVYNPAFPYKDEGLSFITFYYEHLLRNEKVLGRASANATVQYWTPNKTIFEYPYANEVVLDECQKRGVDVFLGWELIKVDESEYGEKFGVFKNVDTGETIERVVNQLICNPKYNV